MDPVRVKVYGLIPITRRRYLVQLAMAALFAFVVLALWYLQWPAVRREWAAQAERERAARTRDRVAEMARNRQVEEPSPLALRVIAFIDVIPWLVLAAVLVQALEAFFVLRAFARKESERPQQPAAAPEPPAGNPPALSPPG